MRPFIDSGPSARRPPCRRLPSSGGGPPASIRLLLGALLLVACEGENTTVGGNTGDPDGARPTPDAAVIVPDGGGPGCQDACEPGTRQCSAAGQVQVCADYDGDGCTDWGGDVACPAGAVCADGACAATCQDACAEGEAVCGADGRRVCGDADGDGCREFLPGVACPAGERCDGGACVPAGQACEDACATDGARSCDGDRYRLCGQHDDDACLDWSVTIQCQPGNHCAGEGECVPDCTDECAGAGVSTCAGEGTTACGNFDADPCLEPGPIVACGADERCDNGACVPQDRPCTADCDEAGARVCDGDGGFRQCGQYDADDCLELSAVVPCAGFEACAEGNCAPTCDDECAADSVSCRGEGPATCGNFDPDPCLEWGPSAPCGPEERCDDGACVDVVTPCEDACTAGAKRCGAGGVETCGNSDDDACTEWGAAVPCVAGQRCEGEGACVDDCVDECTAGARECRDLNPAECGESDGDACLEWVPLAACPPGETCSAGGCARNCSDDCAREGDRECTRDGEVRTCGRFDDDLCLEWSSSTPCGPREACDGGACVVVCQDECVPDQRRCVGANYEVCGNFDPDACLDFGGGAPCGPNQACEAGACLAQCQDECAAGAMECVDEGARSCGNFDGDGCREWSTPQACAIYEECDGGACVDRPAPAGVVINEVLYDAAVVADREAAFIELYGPPGTRLDGLRVVAINGNGGAIYATIEISGNLGPDGFFVITHPDAVNLAAVADQTHTGADLQNGPDSVQLRWGATIVDALAYGRFGAAEVAAGEGDPAPAVAAGQSLSRDARHTDTNSNVADFRVGAPSPGAALPCADACPAEGDVRCTEGVAETCAVSAVGCLDWAASEDCEAAGQLCVDGACEPAPSCVVPTGVVSSRAVAGLRAQHPCMDVLPVTRGGFAIATGTPQAIQFGLTDVNGAVLAPVASFGPTSGGIYGNSASDTYYPQMVFDGAQYAIAWSGFNVRGNRDIHFRRMTAAGQVIPVGNSIISAGHLGFNPMVRTVAPSGFEVLFNAYTRWQRIPVSSLGEPGAVADWGTPHGGDTREDTFAARARTAGGAEALLYSVNTSGWDQPRTLFQRVDANGNPVGNRVDLGASTTAAGWPGVYLWALPNERYGAIWRTVIGQQTRVQSLIYAVLDVNGAIVSQVTLNDLDAPVVYRPNMAPVSAAFDGERIGVLHMRYADGLEPEHYMIQWLTPAGVHIARTELGQVTGVLVKHPDDGLWRVFQHRGVGADINLNVLGCP